jgi:hypothetical protein
MSTVLTKFEVLLPIDTPGQSAVTAFLTTIGGLTNFVAETIGLQSGPTTLVAQFTMCFGLLTNTQAVTALAALNTLNTALVAVGDTAVIAYSYPVTTQP